MIPAALPDLKEDLATDLGPHQLLIPSPDNTAPVVREEMRNNQLTIPGDASEIGRSIAQPGIKASRGTTLLAGHVRYTGQGNSVLSTLHEVRPGALAILTDGKGRENYWRMISLGSYAKAENSLPSEVF